MFNLIQTEEVLDPAYFALPCRRESDLRRIRIWQTWADERLVYEYKEMTREEMRNFVFGNNAKQARKMVASILLSRGITSIPVGYGFTDIKVTTL